MKSPALQAQYGTTVGHAQRRLTAAERAKHATGMIAQSDQEPDWGFFDEKGFWHGGFDGYDDAFAHALMTYKD